MKSALWLLLVLRLVAGSTDVFAASVTLAWDGEPGLRYKVFYGIKSRVYTHSIDAKDSRSIVIDGLLENQVYYFAVRSYNTAGVMSDFSAEVRKSTTPLPPAAGKTGTPASVPAPPQRKETSTQVPLSAPPGRKETVAPVAVPPRADVKPVTPSAGAKATAPLVEAMPANRKETAPPVDVPPPADPKESTTTGTVPVQSDVPRPVATNDVAPPVTGIGSNVGVPVATSNGTAPAPPSNGSAAGTTASAPPTDRVPPSSVPATVSTPPGYLIGPNDVLSVTFWRDKDMNADVVVRPDGIITLPLLNDIQAAGLTPGQLRERILAEAQRYIEDPSPTVAVKEINSRRVFITGQVEKAGAYPLASPMTVLQLIAMAGGLKEFADGKNIIVMRTENGRQVTYQFDYRELLKGKNLRQNIDLKPGDTVLVP